MSEKGDFRLIVCGGDDFADRRFLFDTLDRIHAKRRISLIIEGGNVANHGKLGADTFAWQWAVLRRVPVHTLRVGNGEMIGEGNANGCVAFLGGNDTKDMLVQAHNAGIKCMTPGWKWTPGDAGTANDASSSQPAGPIYAYG